MLPLHVRVDLGAMVMKRYSTFPSSKVWALPSDCLMSYPLWSQKGSLMKTQTRILDNRLYYTRKIELHRKGKKSRTVRITLILICLWQRNLSVLITVRRVHYGLMGKAPKTISRALTCGKVLPHCKDAVGTFYSLSWLGCTGQSGTGSNGNEGILHNPWILRIGVSPPEAV